MSLIDRTDAPDELPSSPLMQHLLELRKRFIRIGVVILVLFMGFYPFANEIYNEFTAPLLNLLPQNSHIIAIEVTTPFLVPLKMTFLCALFVAMPYVLFQVWGFIAPGLYRQEKKIALPTLMMSVLLFYSGVAFAYLFVCPLIFNFFIEIAPATLQVMTDINAYLSFVIRLFLAFGIAFEIPVLTFVLVMANWIDVDTLINKRRYIIVGCFTIAMFLTPPDIFSQTLLAVPMWFLFEAGLLLTRWVIKKRDRP